VVDYQVDFVDGGVFGRVGPAVAIEDALCARVEEYLAAGDPVIYTMDTHPADTYALTREGQVNQPHCDPATEGWQLYGRLGSLLSPSNALQLKKGTYGCPGLPAAVQGLLDQGLAIEYLELAGVSTTCRVLHNAILLYTYFPELPIVLDARTTASYTDEATKEQLEELEAWGFWVKW
jgi:nicotinamidase-related amidase